MTADADSDDALKEKIAQAEAAIAALTDQYIPVLKSEIRRLESLAAEARRRPGGNGALMLEIYRIAHNIKGQGGSFGFHLVTDIGASLCEVTREPGARDGGEIDVIDRHLEAMSFVVSEDLRGDGGDAGRRILEKIGTLTR